MKIKMSKGRMPGTVQVHTDLPEKFAKDWRIELMHRDVSVKQYMYESMRFFMAQSEPVRDLMCGVVDTEHMKQTKLSKLYTPSAIRATFDQLFNESKRKQLEKEFLQGVIDYAAQGIKEIEEGETSNAK